MRALLKKIQAYVARVPVLAWLLGFLVASVLERLVGDVLASVLGLPMVPPLLGVDVIFRAPLLIPSTIVYLLVAYILPAYVVARLTTPLVSKLLDLLPSWLFMLLHLILLYAVLHMWGGFDDYRLLVLRYIGIAIILTVSLNLVNGYMGEFSVAHGGFMAVGAYVSSIFTVWAFVRDDVFGPPALPPALGPFMFPLALILGGIAASIAALLVAIPSFRTRGDYLGVISLALTYIVKSSIENQEWIGGPRGFMNQPKWATLPWTFFGTLLCLVVIYNFIYSTRGKGVMAIRDDEIAAELMTVDTRRTKVAAFLLSAFWAGIAGGLFAHILGYINPGTFGIMKSTECLAMVYLGGLASISGSIVGAVLYTLLIEALRPLGIVKWMVIPTLVILVIFLRREGILGFRELSLGFLRPRKEVEHAPASD